PRIELARAGGDDRSPRMRDGQHRVRRRRSFALAGRNPKERTGTRRNPLQGGRTERNRYRGAALILRGQTGVLIGHVRAARRPQAVGVARSLSASLVRFAAWLSKVAAISSSAARTARYFVRPASSRSSSARVSQSCAFINGSVIRRQQP